MWIRTSKINGPPPIKEKWGWKELPLDPRGCYQRGYYQLKGIYRFWNDKTDEVTNVTGYSTATRTKPRSEEFIIFRCQAIDHARAKLEDIKDCDWVLYGISQEVWLKW